MIKDNQMIYVDAGSSTYEMLNYVRAKNITVVTIGFAAYREAQAQLDAHDLIGRHDPLDDRSGDRQSHAAPAGRSVFLTSHSSVLTASMRRSASRRPTNRRQTSRRKSSPIPARRFVLADGSKFNKLYPVKFSRLDQAVILSDEIPDFDRSQIRYQLTNGESKLD
mgnify:CR=1 FL=1